MSHRVLSGQNGEIIQSLILSDLNGVQGGINVSYVCQKKTLYLVPFVKEFVCIKVK